jgi:hypothetical protein
VPSHPLTAVSVTSPRTTHRGWPARGCSCHSRPDRSRSRPGSGRCPVPYAHAMRYVADREYGCRQLAHGGSSRPRPPSHQGATLRSPLAVAAGRRSADLTGLQVGHQRTDLADVRMGRTAPAPIGAGHDQGPGLAGGLGPFIAGVALGDHQHRIASAGPSRPLGTSAGRTVRPGRR